MSVSSCPHAALKLGVHAVHWMSYVWMRYAMSEAVDWAMLFAKCVHANVFIIKCSQQSNDDVACADISPVIYISHQPLPSGMSLSLPLHVHTHLSVHHHHTAPPPPPLPPYQLPRRAIISLFAGLQVCLWGGNYLLVLNSRRRLDRLDSSGCSASDRPNQTEVRSQAGQVVPSVVRQVLLAQRLWTLHCGELSAKQHIWRLWRLLKIVEKQIPL